MFFANFQVKPEPTMVFKDKLDRVNVWVMRIILLLTFVFIDFYNTNLTIAETIAVSSAMSVAPEWLIYPLVHLVSAGISVVILEVIGHLYYGFVKPLCPPVNLTKKGFMVYIRASYVVRNVVAGALNLIFLSGDIYYHAFSGLIGTVITVLTLAITYLYVNKHYVPEKMKSPFLKIVATPFLVVQFIMIIMGLI